MADSTNATAAHGSLASDDDAWTQPRKQKRDNKKLVLVVGLSLLSWIATYTGMLELIQANLGDISLTIRVAVGFAVVMLQVMIVWLLSQIFSHLHVSAKAIYAIGYVFLTLISVGFGFGFYWKVLESRSEASRSAESAVTQVQAALHGAETRLEQLSTTLVGLTALSVRKAKLEHDKGTSCPNSRPGDGPRRRLRNADADRFQFSSAFVSQRIASIKADVKAFNGDLAKIASMDKSTFDARTGTRNAFMRGIGRKLDLAVTRFNAFRTDPQLRQIRAELAERAGKTVFPAGNGRTFTCPDPQLQSALRGVVRAIDQLPDMEKPTIATVEGSEAVIEAFRRLTTTLFGALQFKLPPSPEELRRLQQKAVQSLEGAAKQRKIALASAGLSKRDYIPLGVAIFVDFCLLLVSIGRPTNGFERLEIRMREAEDSPVIRILSRFRDIHKDEKIREMFEVFRHVVFNIAGEYYAAVPVNGTPLPQASLEERENALEAQLLANLFTSFENEGVFKRVLVPLLTTTRIQRSLEQQGSKFADATSFRVYKFQRDKWSKWVLGAMMGAAKRVEAEKRRLASAEPLGAPAAGPTLAGLPGGETMAAQSEPEPNPSYVPIERPVPAGVEPAAEGAFGPYSGPYIVPEQDEFDVRYAATAAGMGNAHAMRMPTFGFAAGGDAAAVHHEPVTSGPANNNTAPDTSDGAALPHPQMPFTRSERADAEAKVIPLPDLTERAEVPVTEGRLADPQLPAEEAWAHPGIATQPVIARGPETAIYQASDAAEISEQGSVTNNFYVVADKIITTNQLAFPFEAAPFSELDVIDIAIEQVPSLPAQDEVGSLAKPEQVRLNSAQPALTHQHAESAVLADASDNLRLHQGHDGEISDAEVDALDVDSITSWYGRDGRTDRN